MDSQFKCDICIHTSKIKPCILLRRLMSLAKITSNCCSLFEGSIQGIIFMHNQGLKSVSRQ